MQEIAAPLVLQQLILANNKLLKVYQQQLIQEVQEANLEIMRIMGLTDPSWRLDMDRLMYVKTDDLPETTV